MSKIFFFKQGVTALVRACAILSLLFMSGCTSLFQTVDCVGNKNAPIFEPLIVNGTVEPVFAIRNFPKVDSYLLDQSIEFNKIPVREYLGRLAVVVEGIQSYPVTHLSRDLICSGLTEDKNHAIHNYFATEIALKNVKPALENIISTYDQADQYLSQWSELRRKYPESFNVHSGNLNASVEHFVYRQYDKRKFTVVVVDISLLDAPLTSNDKHLTAVLEIDGSTAKLISSQSLDVTEGNTHKLQYRLLFEGFANADSSAQVLTLSSDYLGAEAIRFSIPSVWSPVTSVVVGS